MTEKDSILCKAASKLYYTVTVNRFIQMPWVLTDKLTLTL